MFRILFTILCFSVAVSSQIEIATSKVHNFFVYPESIFRFEDKVLFTAKVTTHKSERIDVILASCPKQTYILVSSQIQTRKNVEWITPRHSKSLLATKNSAMAIALDILCRIAPEPYNE